MAAQPGDAVLCLVTDRRRAYTGPAPERAFECLALQARWAADAGIDLIQVRERDLEAAALADLVARIVEGVDGSRTRVVVNDRIDVALAARAHGVHLRRDSIQASRARTIASDPFLIGCSVHGEPGSLSYARGADYVIAGTVYASASKPGRAELLGVEGLRSVVAAAGLPVLAIGGVTVDRARELAATGAAGAAAIGLFIDERRTGPCRVGALDAVVTRFRRAFVRIAV